jgi:hypothetical protein
MLVVEVTAHLCFDFTSAPPCSIPDLDSSIQQHAHGEEETPLTGSRAQANSI